MFARISFFLLFAGFAGSALAQSDAQVSSGAQCVKTRCFQPTCFKQYAGGYYLSCPDGNHPVPESEQSGQSEADREEQAALKSRQSGPPIDPAAIHAVAGDWELRLGASPKPMAVLHLRPSSTGSLEGTLEQSLGAQSASVSLQDIQVNGATFTYTTPNGKQFRGTLSSDHQTIVGDAGSPTWTRAQSH